MESTYVQVLIDGSYYDDLHLRQLQNVYYLGFEDFKISDDFFGFEVPLVELMGLVGGDPRLEVVEVPDLLLVEGDLVVDEEVLAVLEIIRAIPKAKTHVHETRPYPLVPLGVGEVDDDEVLVTSLPWVDFSQLHAINTVNIQFIR
jgi:hypothetical protein